MRVLLDTNVLVAAVTRDTDRSDEAIELLDQVDDPLVSVLSLMELRSVLSKKKRFERDRIDAIENRVTSRISCWQCDLLYLGWNVQIGVPGSIDSDSYINSGHIANYWYDRDFS